MRGIEGIVNSHLGVTLINLISYPDSNIDIDQTSILSMEELRLMGMVTIVVQVSFYRTTTGLKLVNVTSLLVGTIPIKGGVGGDLEIGERMTHPGEITLGYQELDYIRD